MGSRILARRHQDPVLGSGREPGTQRRPRRKLKSWAFLGLQRPRRRGDSCVLRDPVPEATPNASDLPAWAIQVPRTPTPRPELGKSAPEWGPAGPQDGEGVSDDWIPKPGGEGKAG